MKFTISSLSQLIVKAQGLPAMECEGRFPPSIYYSFFYLLTRQFNPEYSLSVELGVSGGGGSYHLARGNAMGIAVGVDCAWDMPDNIKFITKKCDNFRFMYNDSIEAAKIIHDLYGKIDFLAIDTIHTYQRTFDELNAYKPYLKDGAVVYLDDLYRPAMDGVWESIAYPKIRCDVLHPGSRLDEEHGDGGCGCLIWINEEV